MGRKSLSFALFFGVALGLCFSAKAQDAKSVLQSASKAMGDVKSIQYSGSGQLGILGQAFTPGGAWPINDIKSYTRTIDYGSKSAKEEMTLVEPTPIRKGGGGPFAGEQKQVNLVSGQYAWNQPGNAAQPAIAAAEERQLQIWLTPHGFLKAAMENNATAKKGNGGTVVSFTEGKFKVNGTIDAQGMVTKTATWLPNPVLGDMPVETTYSGYKDFNGVKFPTMIAQKEGGSPVLDLTVSDVRANADLALTVPDNVKAAKIAPVNVTNQKLADGVWFLAGGTHNSVLVEFPNYAVMIESPLNDARAMGIMAEAKKLIPEKPIKYLINTHDHFDHAGGVRAWVPEGATIITQEMNKPFYDQAWKAPRTLEPDHLAQNPKKATFITFKDKYVLSDGGRELDIYRLPGDIHNAVMSLVYLPKEKILVEADDFTPPPPNASGSPGPRSHAGTVLLYEDVQKMKLDVATIAPLHGFVVPFAELQKAASTEVSTASK
ncbi:MAG: MBL fold metallo-hydrolase [Acidobacteria bacterium]|nr:MAG: MBL fold metallo-hydrolase [Acidobacteriota bacterium]